MKNGHRKDMADAGMRKKVGKGRRESGERRDCQAGVLAKDMRREAYDEKNQVDIETLYISETQSIVKSTFPMWKETVATQRP